MFQVSHAVGIIVVVVLLVGFLIVGRRITRRRPRQGARQPVAMGGTVVDGPSEPDQAAPHAHIATMVRQTDAVLTTMARTIAQERERLNALAASSVAVGAQDDRCIDAHERILPLAGGGETVSAIAHRLALPEAEVSLVIRLNAG